MGFLRLAPTFANRNFATPASRPHLPPPADDGPPVEVGTFEYDYTGAAEELEIAADGTITFEMWGAGGGGGQVIVQPGAGGAGGYANGVFEVSAGDVVKIEVGQGGRRGPAAPGNGGLGGWPDGGSGGAFAGGANTFSLGGGGGSTRLYINDTLVAVAGAGGGGIYSAGATNYSGGAGGGTTGQGDERNTNTGGTQSAGGFPNNAGTWSSANALVRGDYLQGGNGWGNASGTNVADETVSTEYTGCGGGGGYYGGSGGYGGERQFLSGSGGSSFINTGHANYVSGSTTAGVGPIPHDTVNRPAGIAVGGDSGNGVQANGADGFALVTYAI